MMVSGEGYLKAAISAIEKFHNKYVVAYISFHDNVLTQEIVEVAKSVLDISDLDELSTLELVQAYAFASGSMISVFKI